MLPVLGRARAWVVGFVLWAVAIVGLGVTREDGTGLGAADGLGSLFLFLLIVSMVRIAWPMRGVGRDAGRLVGGGKSYAVHSFTGRSHSVDRSIASSTQVTGTVYSDALGDVHGQIGSRTTHTVNDRFSLVAPDGREHTVQVSDVGVPIGSGQLVSAVWAIAPGRSRGPYVLFHNHSTGETTFSPRGIYQVAYGGRVALAVLWWLAATLALAVGGHGRGAAFAGVGGALALVLGTRLQAAFFRSVGSRPRVARLRRDADALPAAAPVPAVPPTPLRAVPAAAGPPPPPPPGASTTMAWLADPTGRHEYRYWDGATWTEHVSDHGVATSDALA